MPRRNRVDPWGDLHAVAPRGLFTGMGAGGDPWATTDMRRMTGTMATFARGAAASERELAAEPEVSAEDASGQLEFARKAELVGTEEVDGRTLITCGRMISRAISAEVSIYKCPSDPRNNGNLCTYAGGKWARAIG